MSKIIVTNFLDDEYCKCQFCGKIIANIVSNEMIPAAKECYQKGCVPIPNFGWFCSQNCADEYEKEYKVKFQRTVNGIVDYYNENFK